MSDRIIYGPLELPSGKKVKFYAPLGSDRNNVLQMTQIAAERVITDAMLVDDYIAAKCITEVDGKTSDGDYKRMFDSWPQKDILYFRAVFDEMFGLNEESRDKAKDAAAFLLKGSISTDGSSSPSAVA